MELNKKILAGLIFFTVMISAGLYAGKPPVKYWIKFKDKAGIPFSVSEPQKFMSAKAVNRRLAYNIPVDVTDLPVSSAYISSVASVENVKVIYASRWMNGVVISLDSIDLAATALAKINTFAFVSGTKKVQRYTVETPIDKFEFENPAIQSAKARMSELASSNTLGEYSHGGSAKQNHQMRVDCLHERGYRGQGMTIAVFDAGFAYVDISGLYDSIRSRNGILGTRDFVSGGENAYQGSTHGSMVFSCMAANKPGVILGSAPMADYWLLRTEAPGENLIEEYNWIRGAEFADSVGADILTTSLAYTEFDDASMDHNYATLNGKTAPMSIAGTMAARKGLFVLTAAGNERAFAWHYIGVPADADSVCTVGAVDSVGNDVAFSSVGPTADGRIKPDLSARGLGTWVSADNEICFPGNGTSFATPVLAGGVACYWQANRKLTNMQVLRDLKNNASNASAPNNLVGWGVPNLCPISPLDFTAYIEPTNSLINIILDRSSHDEVSVEVMDLMGRILFTNTIDSPDWQLILDATTLSDSIYLVKLKTSQGTSVKKILKR